MGQVCTRTHPQVFDLYPVRIYNRFAKYWFVEAYDFTEPARMLARVATNFYDEIKCVIVFNRIVSEILWCALRQVTRIDGVMPRSVRS